MFAIGSLAVGFSVNATMIISFRALQGIGSAILQPTCLAIITDTFEGEELQKVIGYYAAVIGAGAVVGIAFGGVCATFISWRVGFLINGPLALIMIIIAVKVLKNSEKKVGKLDWFGTILSVLAMGSITYGIASKEYTALILLISAGLWIVFIISQVRVVEPMMPLFIFKSKERFGAYVGSLLFSAAGVVFWFYIPQFMQRQMNFNAFASAMGMIPMSILLFAMALRAQKFSNKLGNNVVMIIGLGLVFISAIGLSILNATTNYWFIFPFTLTFGAGFALALTPLTSAAMAKITIDHRGAASGVYNTTRQFGAALGLAWGLSVTTGITKISSIFQNVMVLAAGLTAIGIVFVSILVLKKRD